MPVGFHAIVLHAHLPYIRHPEYKSFLEENWLFEAITETYVPLLLTLARLNAAGYKDCLTLSLSPTLMTMLRDTFLQQRYLAHMSKLLLLAEQEVQRTKGNISFEPLARLYQQRLEEVVQVFDQQYNRDLVGAFAHFYQEGVLELITCAGTHGFLPLLKTEPSAVRAQLEVGAQTFKNMIGSEPNGVWLPECGYYNGLETLVEEAGFGYFFIDSHGILNATPKPYYGLSAPLVCPNGVVALGRDPDTSRQVWSRDEGYPGDFTYRDFYRDIGFDLDFEYIKPYVLDGHTRIQTGFKYYRITGPNEKKEPYDLARAHEILKGHAEDFVRRSQQNLNSYGKRTNPTPLIVSPYDAELFGHWWFEGIEWLETVITLMSSQAEQISLTTPSAYLQEHPTLQSASPSSSSWGDGGYNAFWLNPGNDWVYPYLHDAAKRLSVLVNQHSKAKSGTLLYRALQQAARSLLLAQASDWAFIMKSGTSEEYAYDRTREHLARFNYLEDAIINNKIDERRLQALEVMDQIFPNIQPQVFA